MTSENITSAPTVVPVVPAVDDSAAPEDDIALIIGIVVGVCLLLLIIILLAFIVARRRRRRRDTPNKMSSGAIMVGSLPQKESSSSYGKAPRASKLYSTPNLPLQRDIYDIGAIDDFGGTTLREPAQQPPASPPSEHSERTSYEKLTSLTPPRQSTTSNAN